MTLSSRVTEQTMLGDGKNRQFSFSFRVWPGEVRIVVTDAKGKASDVTSQSHIAFAAGNKGGVVTYPKQSEQAALPVGKKLTILRSMTLLQETRLVNATAFDPQVIENQLDRLAATDQQLHDTLKRTVMLPIGSPLDSATLVDAMFASRDQAAQSAATASAQAAIATQKAAEATKGATAVAVAVNGVVLEGNKQVARVAEEGARQHNIIHLETLQYIEKAHNEADRAESVAAALPGFAKHTHSLFGFSVNEQAELLVTKSADGDELDMADYAAWCVLPAEARFFINKGALMMELPFQAR